MDNKDFDEVEDIFGTDLEENYDVPVFNPEENNEETTTSNVAAEEVQSFDNEVESVNDVQEDTVPTFENSVEEVAPVFEDSVPFETTNENSSPVEVEPVVENTVSDVFDVQPEVSSVEPEPVYEDTNNDVNYGPVALEPTYDEEVNEHPDAIVSLNNNVEEKKEDTKLEDIPAVNLADNSSLKFVLVIGVIILIAIFLLPFINKLGI